MINVIDVIRLLLMVYCMGVQIARTTTDSDLLYLLKYAMPMMIAIGWYKIIFVYLGVFTATRYFLQMIKEVSYDIVPFMVILVLTMTSYMHIMATFTFYSEDSEEGVYSGLAKESYVLSLGELPEYESTSLKFGIFFVYSLLIPIILMNLLIAILSDAYERVQS